MVMAGVQCTVELAMGTFAEIDTVRVLSAHGQGVD
jgi:hypothetical protein